MINQEAATNFHGERVNLLEFLEEVFSFEERRLLRVAKQIVE